MTVGVGSDASTGLPDAPAATRSAGRPGDPSHGRAGERNGDRPGGDGGGNTSPGAPPAPGSPAYVARDAANMASAFGRADAQRADPDYLPALRNELGPELADKLGEAATPGRPAVNAGAALPGSEEGNPYRYGTWNGRRGQFRSVSFLNRYGSLVRGRVFAPLPGAADPDTGVPLRGPFPGAVIVNGKYTGYGSYTWAAEDLAERGYVVLAFDPGGDGSSQTTPESCPTPAAGETTPCGGLQNDAPTTYFPGAEDAVDFFWSTPTSPYRGSANAGGSPAGAAGTDTANPYWQLFDRAPDPHPATAGRPYRFALLGQSLGAFVVSALANIDTRVSAVVAWDKLIGSNADFGGGYSPGPWAPVVPGLGIQSEYFATPLPYTLGCFFPSGCQVNDPTKGPDPARELATGYQTWTKAGVDTMVLVTRGSTHLDYVDAPYVPASRYGEDVASYTTTAWLDKYLRHDPSADHRLVAPSFRWLEPAAHGQWVATPLIDRQNVLSFYFCSAWRFHGFDGSLVTNPDVTGAGCK